MRTRRPIAFRRSSTRRGQPRRERAVDLERYREIIPDWVRFADACSRPEPTVLRVRSGRIAQASLVERLEAQGFRLRPLVDQPSFLQVEEAPRPVSLTLEHWLGLFYIQQASTGLAAPALDPERGERVLDMCAAPGGKTTHVAELMSDTGCLVACEISEGRIRGLLGNVYRLGHPNIVVIAADGRNVPEGALFDRVLVDAPCSGEGTLRRRGGRAPNQSVSFLGYVTRVQRQLLEKAIRLTRPGGTVMYVTCTFAPEENEAVVSDVLRRCPVELEPLNLSVPHAPGLTRFGDNTFDPRMEGAARIYPHHFDSGGLFLAKLRRLDGDVSPAHEDEGRATGWSTVPAAFADEPIDPAGATELVRGGLDEVCLRFGVERSVLDQMGWIVRGGRAWMHGVSEWPLASWVDDGWRPVSIGLRVMEFDSRGRARPSNDFLRWLSPHVKDRVLDVDGTELTRLLERKAIAVAEDRRGPAALRLHGDVVGRGAVTGDGLKSEIPKARGADLLRILSSADDG